MYIIIFTSRTIKKYVICLHPHINDAKLPQYNTRHSPYGCRGVKVYEWTTIRTTQMICEIVKIYYANRITITNGTYFVIMFMITFWLNECGFKFISIALYNILYDYVGMLMIVGILFKFNASDKTTTKIIRTNQNNGFFCEERPTLQ